MRALKNPFITIVFLLIVNYCLCQQISYVNVEGLTAYNKWRIQNIRNFLNEDEQDYRQSIFLENYQKMKDHNADPDNTYSIGLNQFSDITEEEFISKYLNSYIDTAASNGNSSSDQEASSINTNQESTTTAGVDWRTKGAVTPVKNQGQCVSCWAFSAAAVLESLNYLQHKRLTNFSEQQLVDCVQQNYGFQSYGCNGGSNEQALAYTLKYGIVSLSSYSYVAVQGKCKVTNPSDGFYPASISQVPNTVSDLQNAIKDSPVSVVVDATIWQGYSSGIFNGCNPSSISLNHAVTAIGYDSHGNWIIKNSWGTNWGQQGYITLAAGNTCGILSYNWTVSMHLLD